MSKQFVNPTVKLKEDKKRLRKERNYWKKKWEKDTAQYEKNLQKARMILIQSGINEFDKLKLSE
jgi:hypothetical protein